MAAVRHPAKIAAEIVSICLTLAAAPLGEVKNDSGCNFGVVNESAYGIEDTTWTSGCLWQVESRNSHHMVSKIDLKPNASLS